MRVLIDTHWPDVVIAILDEQFTWFDREEVAMQGRSSMIIPFKSDLHYPELNAWGALALGCGFLFGFKIER